MALTNRPSPAEVATGIVAGLRNDERLGCVADFDGELVDRIAHVIEGERQHARMLFDFYAIPSNVSPPPAEPALVQWLTYPIGDRQLSAHAFVGDAQHSVCGKLSRQRCRAQRADRRCKLCTYSLSQRAAAWKVGVEERTDG